ncbi:hypothetical protein [Paraglaciecola sp.]|uniref:hypothetical protein n=1 Tax=Paraglaciecola sp. TaxID=1920173 RepID=UPI003EF64CD6
MISIVNISPEHTPAHGVNQYVLKEDRKVLVEYSHNRTANSLVQRLRDAADALEALEKKQSVNVYELRNKAA